MVLQILLDYNIFFLEQAWELCIIFKKGISKSERAENPSPQTQPLEHTSNTYPERNWKGFATHTVVGDQLTQKIGLAAVNILPPYPNKPNIYEFDQLYREKHISMYDTK
jgi:hypothetical protein